MKTYLGILTALAVAASAMAQGDKTDKPDPTATSQLHGVNSDIVFGPKQVEAPNEIKLGRVTATGIGPQLIKTKAPLQLINPAAPAEYWAPDGNADRAPDGHVRGFKLFSFKF